MKVWREHFRVKRIIVGIATLFYLLFSLDIDILLCICRKNLFGYLLGKSARLLHIKPFLEGDAGE